MNDYVAWGTTPLGLTTMELLQNFPDRADLRSGVSFSEGFPANASFSPSPKSPATKLADAVTTREGDGVMVVSPGLRDFMVDLECPELEFLPVVIYDHDGEVASDSYSIANSYHVINVLDEEAMGIVRNPLDQSIMSVQRVVLLPSALDGAAPIFRARGFEQRILVRRDVADAIAASFSGTSFYELDQVRA